MTGWVVLVLSIAAIAAVIASRTDPPRKRLYVSGAVAAAVLIIQLLLVLAAVEGVTQPDWRAPATIANFGFAVQIGLLVGATELISRYRDEPFAPLLSTPGALYILINGGASALAYYLLIVMDVEMKEPLRTFTAGFAAMVFFRSALFNVRIRGVDIPAGPNLVLLIILRALDRTYDRERASPRSKIVRRIVGQLSFADVKDALPALCFDLMQNLSQEETAAINTQVLQLSQSTSMDDRSKMLSLGLALMNLVGESTLEAAVNTLGPRARGFQQVDASMLARLAIPEPEYVLRALPGICEALCRSTDGNAAQQTLQLPAAPTDASLESRVVLLAYQLVNFYGPRLVAVAVNLLVQGSAEDRPSPPPPGPPPPGPPPSAPPPPDQPPPAPAPPPPPAPPS